jgi:hypothetical protein
MELTVDDLKIIEKALQGFVLAKKNAIVQAESMTETVAHAKDLEKTAALLDKIQSVTYTRADNDEESIEEETTQEA